MIISPISSPRRTNVGKIVLSGSSLISFGLLLFILVQLTFQIFKPSPAPRLLFVQDVLLPSVLPPQFIANARNVPQHQTPLTPGVSVLSDHFDFQALDPQTKLLFIAHSGPAPDTYAFFNPQFDADKDSQIDGHIIVFDTMHNVVVGRVDIPQVAGIVAAPDLGRVYAADSNDNIVYAIDEHTLKTTVIPLDENESPDALEYDQNDHLIFVSDPGAPPATNPNGNVNLDNQNLSVIDVLKKNTVTKIHLGHLPKLPTERAELTQFGYDIGHNHYDPTLHRIFVTVQQLTDQSVVTPATPPGGTGELISLDPVTQQVVTRLQLPPTCGTPHGMNIDMQSQIAFIACTDIDPDQHLVQNIVRVDVRTMTVIHDPLTLLAPRPDIVVLDHPLHLLFVGCASGISVFDENGRSLRKLGDYVVGRGTHTLSVNETTQDIYLPLVNVGGRPVLRIVHYNPAGI